MARVPYVSREAPPVFIWYATPNVPMSPEPDAGVGIHHPIFGLVLKEKMVLQAPLGLLVL